jgi:hypothetical protein
MGKYVDNRIISAVTSLKIELCILDVMYIEYISVNKKIIV